MKGFQMPTRRLLVLTTLGVVVTIVSCTSTRGKFLVPEASGISRLEVSKSGTDLVKRTSIIDHQPTIERFLAFLRSHDDGWREPWDTFPTGQYTVILRQGDEFVMSVWIGANWIGTDNRLRSLSDPERVEVLAMLDISRE